MLQPLLPPTFVTEKTAVNSVPLIGTACEPGAFANKSTSHGPSSGFFGAASKTRTASPPAAKIVRTSERTP